MSSISANSSKTLIRQVISILIQLGSIVLIARGLGVAGNGEYALAILLPTFMAMFLSIGLNVSNIYFVGKKNFSLSTIYTTSIAVAILIIFFGLTGGYIFIKLYGDDIFPNISFNVLVTALLIFPFLLLNSFQLSFLRALERFSIYNIISLLQPILLLMMILFLYMFNYLTLLNVIISNLLSSFFLLIFSTFYVIKVGYSVKFQNFSSVYLKQSLSYGLKSHASNLITFINYRADIFLLNLLASPIAVGLYYVAVQIVERLWILSQAMSTVLFPRFVALQDKHEIRISLISKAFRIVILLTFAASLFLILVGYFVIGILFGDEYLEAYYAVIFLIPGVVLGAGSRILANAIAAKGKPELNMYTSVFVMILNILLNILLIPKYGMIGASLATSVAYSFNAILRVWLIHRIEKLFVIKNLYPIQDDLKFIYEKIIFILKKRAL